MVNFEKYLFMWLPQVLVAPCGIFPWVARVSSCGPQAPKQLGLVDAALGLGCSMVCGILFPESGIKPICPTSQILNHWAIREVSGMLNCIT